MLNNKKIKIVAVEDDPEIAELFRIKFVSLGYDVTVAETGKEGIEKITAIKPDIVLLDIGLPDINGIELCKQIKQLPSLKTSVIFMVTAKQDTSIMDKGFSAGADDYITKPIDWDYLIKQIQKHTHKNEKGQVMAEYAVVTAILIFSLVVVTKMFQPLLKDALDRISYFVSLPIP